MAQPIRFPYLATDNTPASLMPRLNLTLRHGSHSMEIEGLLDTGAAINVLPYPVGVALGAIWEEQTTAVPLTGSLGHMAARALLLEAWHSQLTPDKPVRLIFAWTQAHDVPVVFGQVNFFMEFNVCFYRSQTSFEVHPRD